MPVGLPFTVLPFGKEIKNRVKLPKVEESSTSVIGDKQPSDCRSTEMSAFSMLCPWNVTSCNLPPR